MGTVARWSPRGAWRPGDQGGIVRREPSGVVASIFVPALRINNGRSRICRWGWPMEFVATIVLPSSVRAHDQHPRLLSRRMGFYLIQRVDLPEWEKSTCRFDL